ncbi:MAG: hypothetical protein HY000_29385 [Planctomycetes bacterium]|nr:hypothetical protein [Planctomycetota bacterium]
MADLGLKAHRVDVTKISGSIVTEIMEGIAHARIVLGEVSTMANGSRNANVMYEVGLAHALRQAEEVVLFRTDSDRIPFDVASIRIHRYVPTDVVDSRTLIADTIRECLREIDLKKAIKVQQAVESLDDACLGLIEQHYTQVSFGFQQQLTMGQVLTAVPIRLAVFKLLELGVVRCDANMRQHMYAYHWTPFGKAVIARLGFASQ